MAAAAQPGLRDYYAVLGVERSACEAEIRQAYKREALRHHPDKNAGREDEATRMFQVVAEAYSVLSDPSKRALYDSGQLASAAGGQPGAAGGGSQEGFSFSQASELFQQVFGENFVAGLAQAARQAAPHVRAAAEATRKAAQDAAPHVQAAAQATVSAVVGALERRLAQQAQPDYHFPGLAPSAPPPSVEPASGSGSGGGGGGAPRPLSGESRWSCILRCRSERAGMQVCLSASAAGADGLPLGCVDRRLATRDQGVAAQFRECGIEHIGPKEAPVGYCSQEEVAFDGCKLSRHDMLRYVVLRLAVYDPPCDQDSAVVAELEMSSGGAVIVADAFEVGRFTHGQGIVAAVLARSGDRWWLVPARLPCNDSSMQDSVLQDTLRAFASYADEQLRAREQPAAPEAHERPAELDALSRQRDGLESLADRVQTCEDCGLYMSAIEGQEALIKQLMESTADDATSQERLAREFARMDELWSLAARA